MSKYNYFLTNPFVFPIKNSIFAKINVTMSISVQQNLPIYQFFSPFSSENYSIFAFQGNGAYCVDNVDFTFSGKMLIFLSPFQYFHFLPSKIENVQLLQFHGDFYCIEYHKEVVACNGLLFNNVFLSPHVTISDAKFEEICSFFQQIKNESASKSAYSDAILKSYLQLILALSSKEKNTILLKDETPEHHFISFFQKELEEHFIQNRNVQFYADRMNLSSDAFSKKIKQLAGKTPSKIIQERVVLEAKKQLHLTHKSVKEIAFEMNFDDEFYFSRFFKKMIGVSPSKFRKTVGISIVAKKSI